MQCSHFRACLEGMGGEEGILIERGTQCSYLRIGGNGMGVGRGEGTDPERCTVGSHLIYVIQCNRAG